MVTFNQVLSGSDVNTQEHTQVMLGASYME